MMNMAYATDFQTAHTAGEGRIAGFVAEIKDRMARRAIFNETFRELSVLSDRELSDLGISRAGIGRIAREAAYN